MTLLQKAKKVLAAVLLSSLITTPVLADDPPFHGDIMLIQYNSGIGLFEPYFLGSGVTETKFMVFNGGTLHPDLFTPGTCFSSNTSTKAIHIADCPISQISGLQTALNGKASSTHSHVISDVTGLQAALDAKLNVASSTMSFATSSRALTTSTGAAGFQISASQNAMVTYAVNVATVASLGTPAAGYITLEISPTNSPTSTDWYEVGTRCRADNTVGLLAVQSSQANGCSVSTIIPAGYYAKLRSVNVSGTPTYSFVSGHEVKM